VRVLAPPSDVNLRRRLSIVHSVDVAGVRVQVVWLMAVPSDGAWCVGAVGG